MDKQQDIVEVMAAALWDHDHNAAIGSLTARMLFGRDRITYAEVKKGVEDDVYTEAVLPNVRARARAALAALEQVGYVVVPVEPTEEMLQGACGDHKVGRPMALGMGECPHIKNRRAIYTAMLSARPSPLKIE